MPALTNSTRHYGLVSIALHWLLALLLTGLFGLGLWMTGLSYYDPWYNRAPSLHEGLGLLVLLLILLRLGWRLRSVSPSPLGPNRPLHLAAGTVHWLLYLLMLAIPLSGYLMATADGKPLVAFGLSLPSPVPGLLPGGEQLADQAGEVHALLAWALMFLAGLHALAAFFHHFVLQDATLRRMINLKGDI